MKRFLIAFCLCATSALALSSCVRSLAPAGETADADPNVYRTWVVERADYAPDGRYFIVYSPESATMQPLQRGGLLFKPGGELVSYSNAGWCGTPPITYAEFPGGRWFMLNDKKLFLERRFWDDRQALQDTAEIIGSVKIWLLPLDYRKRQKV